MSLARRLKELRGKAGLSQTELAKLAGVSRNAVSQWESGETQPATRHLAVVARALEVSVDQIMAPSTESREHVVEAATRLFARLDYDVATVEVICAAADVSQSEFTAMFGTKDDLLYEVAKTYIESTFSLVRRIPPKYGSLAARVKYLLRMLYVHDLENLNLIAALNANSWRWNEARERELARHHGEYHDTMMALFEEACAQGQIDQGNFRAASILILGVYTYGLRKALYERFDADRLVAHIEPQISIILDAFAYRVVPGFADEK